MYCTVRLWFRALAAVTLLAITPLAFAQDVQFRGRIQSASAKYVTVATGQDPRVTVRINEETLITVGGVPATARNLKPGYRVRVEAVSSRFGGLEAMTIQASH